MPSRGDLLRMKRSKQERKYGYRGLEPIMEDHSTVELIANRHAHDMSVDVFTET